MNASRHAFYRPSDDTSSAVINAAHSHQEPGWNSADLTFPELAQIQQARRAWLKNQQNMPTANLAAPIPSEQRHVSSAVFGGPAPVASQAGFGKQALVASQTAFGGQAPVVSSASPSFLTDPYVINADELASMQDFFQTELHDNRTMSNPPLFDQTETQFLSNFLDGFLNESSLVNQQPAQFGATLQHCPVGPSYRNANALQQTQSSTSLRPQFHPEMPINSSSALFVQQTGEFYHDYHPHQQQQQHAHLPAHTKLDANARSISSVAAYNFHDESPSLTSTSSALSNSKPVPGTVPVPVIAPRKKRHRSKDLLSEGEKRANHIASEQKRRRNIRMGFKALTMLIPSLRSMTCKYDSGLENSDSDTEKEEHSKKKRKPTPEAIGPSKSIVLSRTIEHLEFLMERETVLSERLRKLQLAKQYPRS